MSPLPQELSVEEFRALRATIRERGSLRVFVAAITFVAWPALVATMQIWLPAAIFSLLPLVALAAGFEAILSLHVGVERIGRYLQIFYESDRDILPGWEHAAMHAPARAKPSGSVLSIDPLFATMFLVAALLNLVLATFGRPGSEDGSSMFWVELTAFSFAHAVFAVRVVRARRFSAGQRERDLALYRAYAESRNAGRSK